MLRSHWLLTPALLVSLNLGLSGYALTAQAQSSSTAAAATDSQLESILSELNFDSVVRALQNSDFYGLDPEIYWTTEFDLASRTGVSSLGLLRGRILAAYGRALKELSTGALDPSTVAKDIKLTKKKFYSVDELRTLIASSGRDAGQLLEKVSPQFPQYRSLRAAYQRLSTAIKQGTPELVPSKKELKLGVRDANILNLKQRLKLLGHQIYLMDDYFDRDTLNAVNDIQKQLKMKPDGIISPRGKTWSYLTVPLKERLKQVAMDLEKLRWLPQNLEDRHIFVNTMFSEFLLVDRAAGLNMSFKTVNGRAERKTPMLRDRITYLVINPTWTIPPTVFLEDKVETLKRLDYWGIQDYFYQNQFEVFTADFKRTIDPTFINWGAIETSKVDFYIRQKPGVHNALGVVKFMMTNPYAIYLHDTNEKHLFAEAQRLRSSGCVRLERPLDLAEYLLAGTEWNRSKIENTVAKPWDYDLKETRVNLKNPMPVYLMPITSTYSSDGIIRFVEDAYSHNQIMKGLR